MFYSIEFTSKGNKGLIDGTRFGEDGLTAEQATELVTGYLSYTGRIRVWNGNKLVCTYERA